MNPKELLEKLEADKEYQGFKSLHPDSYFSYLLKTIDEKADAPWQLGFYNPKSQKMITFVLGDEISIQPEEEVFKKPDMDVKEIELDKIKAQFDEVMQKADDFLKEKYEKEIITKKIVILQNLEEFGTIWNLTMISQTFNTINIKMSAEDANVLHDSCENFLNFVQGEK